jgi:hypothetical protein
MIDRHGPPTLSPHVLVLVVLSSVHTTADVSNRILELKSNLFLSPLAGYTNLPFDLRCASSVD